jgi:hypothetical protein
MRPVLLLLAIASLAGMALAQPDPNAPQPPQPPQPPNPGQQAAATAWLWGEVLRESTRLSALPGLLLRTPEGLLVLRAGVLARVDPITLQPGATIELFGPLPAPEANAADPQARQKQFLEVAKRLWPAAWVPQGPDLLVVIGDQYLRVEVATLVIKVNVSLAVKAELVPDRIGTMGTPPTLLVAGTTLYLTRGTELLAINVADGKVLTRGTLPATMGNPLRPRGR